MNLQLRVVQASLATSSLSRENKC